MTLTCRYIFSNCLDLLFFTCCNWQVEHRTNAAFVLSQIVCSFLQGQVRWSPVVIPTVSYLIVFVCRKFVFRAIWLRRAWNSCWNPIHCCVSGWPSVWVGFGGTMSMPSGLGSVTALMRSCFVCWQIQYQRYCTESIYCWDYWGEEAFDSPLSSQENLPPLVAKVTLHRDWMSVSHSRWCRMHVKRVFDCVVTYHKLFSNCTYSCHSLLYQSYLMQSQQFSCPVCPFRTNMAQLGISFRTAVQW